MLAGKIMDFTEVRNMILEMNIVWLMSHRKRPAYA